MRSGYKVIHAPIEEFCYPGFRYAFAALNTLRYLETWFAWNRHFWLMRHTLEPGGRYLINLSLVNEPELVTPVSWTFSYRNAPHRVDWQVISFDRLDEQLVERVTITEDMSQSIVHQEHQVQLWVTPHGLSNWLAANSDSLQLVGVWDNTWNELQGAEMFCGGATYWLELLRK